jgi:hypothetical protein
MRNAMSGADPSETASASDEVIDAIADIEMERQVMEKEGGLAASCSSALRRLHELLDREQEALQLHGPDARHPENVEAVAVEIERVKGLSVITSQRPAARSAYPGQRNMAWRNAPRNPARNKGRRTMGRAGGR